jgi:hypothetical protein
MLSAVRHADSSEKFDCASQPAVHRSPWNAEPWTRQESKIGPCTSTRYGLLGWHNVQEMWTRGGILLRQCTSLAGHRMKRFGSVRLEPIRIRRASVALALKTLKYRAIADLHTFQFTAAHALGFSVFTSRLLATDFNMETSTSNHYEVFLLFRFRSVWNFGTKNSSGLTPPAYDRLVTALELTLSKSKSKSKSHCDWRSVSQ